MLIGPCGCVCWQDEFYVEWVHPALAFELLHSHLDYHAAQKTAITGTEEEKEVLLAQLNAAWLAMPPYLCSATVSATGGLILRPNDTTPRACEPPSAGDNKAQSNGKTDPAKVASAKPARLPQGHIVHGRWNNVDTEEVANR